MIASDANQCTVCQEQLPAGQTDCGDHGDPAQRCRWCKLFETKGKADCGGFHCAKMTKVSDDARNAERTRAFDFFRKAGLDEASKAMSREAKARKQGNVRAEAEARGEARAFQKLARWCAPPKPKKTRAVRP